MTNTIIRQQIIYLNCIYKVIKNFRNEIITGSKFSQQWQWKPLLTEGGAITWSKALLLRTLQAATLGIKMYVKSGENCCISKTFKLQCLIILK